MTDGGFGIGIDFGTSNTAAVLSVPDGPTRPVLFDGAPLLPSAVYADFDGTLLVGRDALHAGKAHPQRLELSPKRAIDDGTLLLGDVEVPVVDAIAAILRRVRVEAQPATGHVAPPVAVTFPAGWGTRRQEVLRAAVAAAFGRDDAFLVEEPVAAAHHFAHAGTAVLPALVYDLGAGTFDASVVDRVDGELRVLAVDGVPDVGGLDVDEALVDVLGVTYAERDPALWRRLTHPDTPGDWRLRRALRDDVRAGKEMLSRSATTLVHVPLFDTDAPIGREQLDLVARPALEQTVAACRRAVASAGVEPAAIYLVGGSSRIPLVATLLLRAFQVAPVLVDQPELAVASGSLLVRPHLPRPRPAPTDLTDLTGPAEAAGPVGPVAVTSPAPSHAAESVPSYAAEPASAESPAGQAAGPPAAGPVSRRRRGDGGVRVLPIQRSSVDPQTAGTAHTAPVTPALPELPLPELPIAELPITEMPPPVSAPAPSDTPSDTPSDGPVEALPKRIIPAHLAAGAVHQPAPQPSRRAWPYLLVTALVLGGGAVAAYANGADDQPDPPVTGAACLVGTWQEQSSRFDQTIGTDKVRFEGSGVSQRYRADGTSTVDTRNRPYTGDVNGHHYVLEVQIVGTYTYSVVDGTISYSNGKVEGSTTVRRDGQVLFTNPAKTDLPVDNFECSGDAMRQWGQPPAPEYTITLKRLNADR